MALILLTLFIQIPVYSKDFMDKADEFALDVHNRIVSGELYSREIWIEHTVIPGIGFPSSNLIAHYDLPGIDDEYGDIVYLFIENNYSYLSYRARDAAYYRYDGFPVKTVSVLFEEVSLEESVKLSEKVFYFEEGECKGYYCELNGEPVQEENPDSIAAGYYENALNMKSFFENLPVLVPSILWDYLY
ncbi:hypothetical protein JXA84_08015 [candidate division WOR-3 bacterium]|nr:hypothetical protein [candidate division WOR-3 bacterium]